MTEVNRAFFGFPAVLGNPGGVGAPYHPGPFYIALTFLVDSVASLGVGNYTPMLLAFVLLSLGMYGAAAWLVWKVFGPWAAVVLLAACFCFILLFQQAVGDIVMPGNQNLQGPSGMLALAGAAALSRGLRVGYLAVAVAFVPLAHAHWGSLPFAIVILVYAAAAALRAREPLRVLAVPAAIVALAVSPWLWLAVQEPRYYVNAVTWFVGAPGSGAGQPSPTHPALVKQLGFFFSLSEPGPISCGLPECEAGSASLLVLLVCAACAGAVAFFRAKMWFFAALTVGSVVFSGLLLLQNPDVNSGPRLFYTSVVIWVFSVSFLCGRVIDRWAFSRRAGPVVLCLVVGMFPLSFLSVIADYSEFSHAPLTSDLSGLSTRGTVIMADGESTLNAAFAIAAAEWRRGVDSCLWAPGIDRDLEGNKFVLSPTSPSSLRASPCPSEGDLVVLNPKRVHPQDLSLTIPGDPDLLRFYRVGEVRCEHIFPCRDLSQEFSTYFGEEK